MRLNVSDGSTAFDELVRDWFGREGSELWPTARYQVPTDVFHLDDRLVIRMDLPGVDPDSVDVTIQENQLVINGTRPFPYDAEKVRFLRRGCFYGDFTQRVTLGKGLDLEKIGARYHDGVLELTVPYAEEVQPRKVAIEVGNKALAE